MWQTLFYLPIFNIPVYGYGVMLVIGFIAAMYLAQYLARRSNLDPEIFANVAIIALVTGVIGARLSHVLENISWYTNSHLPFWENFWNAVNIRQGGLTYYGGFLLAFPCCVMYGIWKKVPIPTGMDIIAPCVMIGLAFGRIGCFLNGCCYGANANVPWAVEFPYSAVGAYADQVDQGKIIPPVELQVPTSIDHFRLATTEEINQGYVITASGSHFMLASNAKAIAATQHSLPVHPAQIYSTITSLLISAIALCYFFTPHSPGRGLALVFMLEGPSRFLLEMLRVEPPVLGPMSLSMVIGLGMFVVGVVLWFALGKTKDRTPQAPSRDTGLRPVQAA
jgi:phosphatidylglycerol:prolipoprotein diacylglycerol transferase